MALQLVIMHWMTMLASTSSPLSSLFLYPLPSSSSLFPSAAVGERKRKGERAKFRHTAGTHLRSGNIDDMGHAIVPYRLQACTRILCNGHEAASMDSAPPRDPCTTTRRPIFRPSPRRGTA